MECLFHGDSDGAFFRYDDIEKRRKLKTAYYPLFMYEKRGINIPDLAPMERRIMSVDVALMASKKHANDATAIAINVALPNGNSYSSNIVYLETFEGLTTDELGITVMRYFNYYKCTDLVLDSGGNGLGVYDFIIKQQYDPLTGDTYSAMKAVNDDGMAERCRDNQAIKCVWCIKASAEFNSNAATSLRNGIKNGNINLLKSEFDMEETFKKIPNFKKLTTKEQSSIKMPYIQTSLMVNEMINLDHEITSNNKVKLKERSGMRKDRYSALMYNYYVVQELSKNLKPKTDTNSLVSKFRIRRGEMYGMKI